MSDNHIKTACWLLIAFFVVASPSAPARKSDRNQPMDIESGKQEGSLDDRTPTILSGGVTIDQGTLHAEASRAEIRSRGGDISQVVMTGSPASLRQQMDDGSHMSAVASKIDYNVATDTVVFTGAVSIKQPRGTLSGERVIYDMTTGQVTSGGEGNGRVKMRIMPKNAAPAPAADKTAPARQPQPAASGAEGG